MIVTQVINIIISAHYRPTTVHGYPPTMRRAKIQHAGPMRIGELLVPFLRTLLGALRHAGFLTMFSVTVQESGNYQARETEHLRLKLMGKGRHVAGHTPACPVKRCSVLGDGLVLPSGGASAWSVNIS
ncbi:jg22818 [Pararge aegeria aegeria]|uniref:Jg22818 protein n=1 Tax=Pararge aegeria aegeria TaxID=348720 RepID=A0A8S4RXV8_9NEOP|nr:jg22818 [Pararge aegeria aegeria]